MDEMKYHIATATAHTKFRGGYRVADLEANPSRPALGADLAVQI